MFLKYNISNIKREKRLLNVKSYNVDLIDDNYYKINVVCDSPHGLKANDTVVFNREIENCVDYLEVKRILSKKRVRFECDEKLSLNDMVLMSGDEEYNLVVNDISYGSNKRYSYICHISNNVINYPKLSHYYLFYKDNQSLNVGSGNWVLLNNNDIVHVSNDYYWLFGGEVVKITDNIDNLLSKYSSFRTIRIKNNDFTENTFTFRYEKYKEFNVIKTYDFNDYALIEIDETPQVPLKKGDNISVRKEVYKYELYNNTLQDGENVKEITSNPSGSTKYMGSEYVCFSDNIYKWKPTINIMSCEVISEKLFKYQYGDVYIMEGDVIKIEDNFLINNNKYFNYGVNFYEYNESINITLPISSDSATELNDENIINNYFNEKKNELIPGIVDYEKRCFVPYAFNKQSKNFDLVNKIKFNLFFRDRRGSNNWVSNDTLGWFQYTMNDDGKTFSKTDIQTNGDLLGNLGFNDEDIYYRKKKIEKSFLRLSFYDSPNPTQQMLLFYSTIFFDTGDLYNKYVNNIDEKGDGNELVYKDLGTDSLTASFTVYDRYNKQKSSEGFYLYLFPDGLEDGKERIIYMKVEFNHAGNGYTIPFILPWDNNGNFVRFGENGFPTSLMIDGNLQKFYDYLYIPIGIRYKSDTNEFVYYLRGPYGVTLSSSFYNNNTITINLYEPKINPLT